VFHVYETLDVTLVALRGVDMEIPAGSITALIGASGMGKSTLLQLLGGAFQPTAGEIRIGHHQLHQMSPKEVAGMRASDVALVLQDPTTNLISYATAADNFSWVQRGTKGRSSKVLFDAGEIFERLGIANLAHQRVEVMSGGEQQRIALATALASEPRVLLVDEPTSQLDGEDRERVLDLLETLNKEFQTTVIVVTHDPYVVERVPRSLRIHDGRITSEILRGREYAVVSPEGLVQLSEELMVPFRGVGLAQGRRDSDGVHLHSVEPQTEGLR
jgi:ABC-type lipoprotein export system ATPase subunit